MEHILDFGEFMYEREFDKEEREKLAKRGHALPDGSFPIVNKEDLENAKRGYGRSKDPEMTKKHIIKRARAIGAYNMIPDNWKK